MQTKGAEAGDWLLKLNLAGTPNHFTSNTNGEMFDDDRSSGFARPVQSPSDTIQYRC